MLAAAGFEVNSSSVIVPLERTLMAEERYLASPKTARTGVFAGLDEEYRRAPFFFKSRSGACRRRTPRGLCRSEGT